MASLRDYKLIIPEGEMIRKTDWEAVLARWQQSDMTQTEFCLKERLPLKSFHYHKRRLDVSQKKPSEFVELNRKPEAKSIELILGDGMVVRIPGDIEPHRLAQLVGCLR